MVKNLPATAGDIKRCRFDSRVRKILWQRAQQPTLVFLPGESHGQRSLASYSPWGCQESDTTEHTHAHRCTDRWIDRQADMPWLNPQPRSLLNALRVCMEDVRRLLQVAQQVHDRPLDAALCVNNARSRSTCWIAVL